MSEVILTYDLHGTTKAKDAFRNYLDEHEWYDLVNRSGVDEKLPNTTLLTEASPETALLQLESARSAGRRVDARFRVTHWSLGPYDEYDGGYDPVPLEERVEALRGRLRTK